MSVVRDRLFTELLRMYRMSAVSKLSEFLEGETATMLWLADAPSSANPSVISDVLHLSRARVAQILTTLQKKGFVAMVSDSEDRRKTLVTLTKLGKVTIETKRKFVEDYFDLLIAKLGDEKVAKLSELLGEIVDDMEDTPL